MQHVILYFDMHVSGLVSQGLAAASAVRAARIVAAPTVPNLLISCCQLALLPVYIPEAPH